MTTSEKQRQQQSELHKKLWAMANDLRGQMDAYEFKDYILGLIFYRYLSEKVEFRANELLKEDEISFAEAWGNEEYKEDLAEYLVSELGYVIEPQYLFSNLVIEIEKGIKGNFDVELLQNGVKAIEASTLGTDSQEDFQNLFDDMDLTSSKLGRTVEARSKLIAKVVVNIAEIPFLQDDVEIDVLGDAYEYMISQFAANAGKKAGEFYTPQQVSRILAKIVTAGKSEIRNVYDGTCGSGSLLLRVGKEARVYKYFGQEKVSTTYNLARMNMLLHDIPYKRFDIKNADTLEEPQHLDERFEAIVANPPYSAKWSADDKFKDDERFSAYSKLAPKSKADFAFVQHFIHQLDDNGTFAVVLPHGVLFRGAAEGAIRKYLIEEKNYLDAVIGLPANIFYGTSIPTCILVFKKCRKHDDNVIFIDASNEFEKGKNQNLLTDENVEKIVSTYLNRDAIDKYSHAATLEQIKENDYNLNIPRYVDTFEEEEPVDLDVVAKRLKEIDEEIIKVDRELEQYFKELGV
ncbi:MULTISPECIES: type I restriction-modification system subunit M [Bacillus]|uniref:type I restriction-modification system subunit M n=1 Tax=Bacillus TaxID=1386 RepID=UPI000352C7DC|nr:MULTISPECIES: type I restriction-modification system subunit M [Bacillus]EPF03439.1 type I restriction-modification system, M subunit [Bacillus toyonensis]MBY7134957.1 type I restriction-modification system subunit M [Bacillus sp. 12RED03]MCH5469851.1 type I restriction-modification system subunit M [Bacillus toyonensis]MCU4829001.1 type I restriction-modification system subunit M [Bacillus toyonensis]PGD82341.1 type I restriction-modification system subunit M [Bacillus toyonensis]